MIKRTITAIHNPTLNEFFCEHCHAKLYRPGTINQITGYPEECFWYVDGANRTVCVMCNNGVSR